MLSRAFMCALMVSAILLLTGIGAGAETFYTGNDLFLDCIALERSALNPAQTPITEQGAVLRQGLCGGMVSGVHYMVSTFRPELEDLKICLPEKTTDGQMLSVVVQWLKAHPEQRAERFHRLVIHAMQAAWPCR